MRRLLETGEVAGIGYLKLALDACPQLPDELAEGVRFIEGAGADSLA
jgi:hypothetical protein